MPGQRADALLLGLIAAVVSAAGNAVPSVWYDEAASIGAATRTLPALAGLLGHLDAVHGLYYALLHLWFQVVAYSPFTLRLPSALAVGATVLLLVRIGTRLGGRRVGVTAGIVGVLLPALTWSGGEGRSYALTAFAATASTAALLYALAIESAYAPRARRVVAWVAYALIAALGSALFLYLLLMPVAHAVTVVLAARRGGRRRRGRLDRGLLARFAAASVGAVVLVSPLVVVAARESSQISWIDPLSVDTLTGVLVNQWFTADPLYAGLAWSALIAAAVVVVRGHRRMVGRRTGAPSSVSVAVPWLVVPLGLVLAASAFGGSYYLPRYLTFAAPGVALLLGAIAARMRARHGAWLLIALTVLAIPTLVGSRLPNAKQHSGWSALAGEIGDARAAEPDHGAGDAAVYGLLSGHSSATTHLVALAYPAGFRHTVDVTAIRPITRTGHLWEPREPLAMSLDRVQTASTVWLVTDSLTGDTASDTAALESEGLHPSASWHSETLVATRFTR